MDKEQKEKQVEELRKQYKAATIELYSLRNQSKMLREKERQVRYHRGRLKEQIISLSHDA